MSYFAPLNCVLAYVHYSGSRICKFRLFALEPLLLLSQDQLFVVSYICMYILPCDAFVFIVYEIYRERGTTVSISDFCFVKNRSNPQCSDHFGKCAPATLNLPIYSSRSAFVLCVRLFLPFINKSPPPKKKKRKRYAKDITEGPLLRRKSSMDILIAFNWT